MSCTDPIADMLTAIRNAVAANKDRVDVPWSQVKLGIAQVLKDEGYVNQIETLDTKPAKTLRIALRYGTDGEPAIHAIVRISTPGRRQYRARTELRPVIRGLGISVLTTSQGILSDRICRAKRIGGEVLCTVH
jgi:small subunit ribosomal protein S8